MNPFAWLRPRSASTSELAEQLVHADRALKSAQDALAAARTAFDDEPTESQLKQVNKARELEAGAREHHARAERLLGAAREREAKERQAALEKRQAELQAELAHHQLIARRQPALDGLMAALVAAVEAEGERAAAEQHIGAVEQELFRVRSELGQPVDALALHTRLADAPPSRLAVAERLHEVMVRYPADDSRRELARVLLEAFGGVPRVMHAVPRLEDDRGAA